MIGELPSVRVKLPVLKVRVGQSCRIVLASESVCGFQVHWLDNRSYMCPGDGCEACAHSLGSRWNGFFVVRVDLVEGRRVMLLEVSPGCFDRLHGLATMEGFSGLAGLECLVSRPKARGGLVIDPVDARVFKELPLVPAAKAWDAIGTLYGLPAMAPGESLEEWEARARAAAARLVVHALRRCAG